jgi:LPXTG-site transpeptidase (sortase) family protein
MKFQLKKVAILSSLSLALFFGSYYLVNFIDLHPAPKNAASVKSVQTPINDDAEFKKRFGSNSISLIAYEGWAKINNLSGKDVYDADIDGDELPNYLEYVYGTDPNKPDSDNDGYSDSSEIANGYDPASKDETKVTVSIKIDKIGIDAPMVWSKTDNDANMLSELENGLSHFVKTAAPGQKGNMIISGHSSNYIWAKGNYNHIFKDLNNLEVGDIVFVKVVQRNGRIIEYQYKVIDSFITAPNDEKIFAETPTPTLTLSTCWPLGTNLRRVIIKAELVK